MAGSWIKFRHDLIDAPEIRRLSRSCGVTRDDVYGKLFRLWSWFDRHSHNGRVADETAELVDEIVGHSGFAAALVSVGWLAQDQGGIVIPNWERHNSETAKERALAASRQERARGKPTPEDKSRSERDGTLTGSHGATVTREDETREELPPLPRDGFDKATWQRLRKAWNAGAGKPWKPVNPHPKAVERMAERDWLADALLAIDRLKRCRFFRTPVSLGQFCGPDFVTLCNGGEYDDRPEDRKGDFANAPAPPRAFTGDVAEAFDRTRRKLAAAKEGT
jgi:hypothetical protein